MKKESEMKTELELETANRVDWPALNVEMGMGYYLL